jgi:hypothetical protein
MGTKVVNKTKAKKCCMGCNHLGICPIVIAWIEATGEIMRVFSFYCSEFELGELPATVRHRNKGAVQGGQG